MPQKRKSSATKKSPARKKASSRKSTAKKTGRDSWQSHPVSVSHRGQTFSGHIGIAVPGLSKEAVAKFFELASLCAQHAVRSGGPQGPVG